MAFMLTTREKAEVMMASIKGGEVECRALGASTWKPCGYPNWQWGEYEYRIKPTPKIRPYRSKEEFSKAMQEHGMFLIPPNTSASYLPVRNNGDVIGIVSIDIEGKVEGEYVETGSLLRDGWSWLDGTPCGIEELS